MVLPPGRADEIAVAAAAQEAEERFVAEQVARGESLTLLFQWAPARVRSTKLSARRLDKEALLAGRSEIDRFEPDPPPRRGPSRPA